MRITREDLSHHASNFNRIIDAVGIFCIPKIKEAHGTSTKIENGEARFEYNSSTKSQAIVYYAFKGKNKIILFELRNNPVTDDFTLLTRCQDQIPRYRVFEYETKDSNGNRYQDKSVPKSIKAIKGELEILASLG